MQNNIQEVDIEQELNLLSTEIERGKAEMEQEKGSIRTNESRLKDEFKFASVDMAKKGLAELQVEDAALATEIKEKFNKLREDYEW